MRGEGGGGGEGGEAVGVLAVTVGAVRAAVSRSAAFEAGCPFRGRSRRSSLWGRRPCNMERCPWRDHNAGRLGSGRAETGCVHNLCLWLLLFGSNGASSMITLRLLASRASNLGGADAVLRLAAPSGAASSL